MAKREKKHYQVITFDGESFEIQHEYDGHNSTGADVNYLMHRNDGPVFVTFDGEWYYGNDEATDMLHAGRIPLMFIPNSEALWRRYQPEPEEVGGGTQ